MRRIVLGRLGSTRARVWLFGSRSSGGARFETGWRAAQRFLREREGVDVASPASAVRQSHAVGPHDAPTARKALEMVSDRNLTTHTDNEALAARIFGRLGSSVELIDAWLDTIEARARDW